MTVRALVLAAGLGTRLRPLTDFVPKPLLPIRGRPLISYSLERLARAGVEAAAVNLHHLGDRVEAALGDSFRELPILYSWEREKPLGTGGALLPLIDFFRGAEVVVIINGDSLCRWPIKRLLRRHRRSAAAATLLLSERAPTGPYGGGVGVDATGALVDFWADPVSSARRRHVFAGAHALSPRLLDRLERCGERPDLVRDLYLPLLESGGAINSVITRTAWHDLGRPNRYLDALLGGRRGEALGGLAWRRSSWRAESARLGKRVRLRRTVIEGGARVEASSSLSECLVFPGAHIGSDCELRRAIVGPGVSVPAGAVIHNRLITAAQVKQEPLAGQSLVGDLVFTPIHDEET